MSHLGTRRATRLLRRLRVWNLRSVRSRFPDSIRADLAGHSIRRSALHLAPEAVGGSRTAEMQAGRDFFPLESGTMEAQHGTDTTEKSAPIPSEGPATELLREQLPRSNKP